VTRGRLTIVANFIRFAVYGQLRNFAAFRGQVIKIFPPSVVLCVDISAVVTGNSDGTLSKSICISGTDVYYFKTFMVSSVIFPRK
jgi:hypothetical protein